MRIEGKRLAGGKAMGPALVSSEPISFLGGIDPTTGEVLDQHSSLKGRNVSGLVLAFPGGKGSTVGSYVLYGLARRGRAPAALVVERPDTIVTVGAVIGDITAVYGISPDIFHEGEWLEVDGEKGSVRLRDVRGHHVVTSFVRNRGQILLLKRSGRVSTFRGRWAGVSGYLEPSEVPVERALREIAEEIGVTVPRLVAFGERVYARDGEHLYVIHPFIFDIESRRIRLDWEHDESKWVHPARIGAHKTVPKLTEAYKSAARAIRSYSRH